MRRRQLNPEIEIDDFRHWQSELSQQRTFVDFQRPLPAREPVRRIVLVGKTGHGKSATGNTILGCTRREDWKFSSTGGLTSKTRYCEKHEAIRFGKRLVVVDTPGLFDTNSNGIETEIGRCVCLSQPGPHVFLLVVNINDRYTPEEKKNIEKIEQMFGELAKQYTIVLFTGLDNLEFHGEKLEGKVSSDELCKSLVGKFGNRYIGLNNRKQDDEQVEELVEKIEDVLHGNGGHFYTNDMYKTASIELHKAIDNILRERLPDIIHREHQCKCAEDIDNLWSDEVKAAVEEATGVVATVLRNLGFVSFSAVLSGAGGVLIAKWAVAGSTVAGPVGAAIGAGAAGAALAIGYKKYKKK